MSAVGAVTGQGVYSELEYRGRRFKLAQWYNDAMDAVSTAAFLKSAHMVRMMGGNEKAIAQREVALARTFSLGGFGFDAIIEDGGLDNEPDLLATFLFKLLYPHDATITMQLALDMVREERAAVIAAVDKANPQNTSPKDKTGQAGASSPVVVDLVTSPNSPNSN